MGRLLDRWIDIVGQVNRQMDRWIDGQIGRQMDRLLDRWIDIVGQVNRQMDRWIDCQKDNQLVREFLVTLILSQKDRQWLELK